jgi:formylglycine-generating enzyme required for sulfatase activity
VKIRPIRRPAPSAPEAQGDPPAGIGFLPDPDLARTAPGPAPSNVPGGASKAPRAPDASRDARGNPVVVRDDGGRDPDTRRPCELWLPVATESGLPCVFEFVLVPPGSFRMGSPASERERNLDEEPVHEVAFEKPFYLGKYAVTQAQWAALTGSNPSRFRDAGQDAPVESVSWEDCREFLARLNARFAISGFRFRLPSEAEWEYSCRAGTWTRFHSGDSAEDLGRAGWFEGNSGSAPHAVGRKTPNAWGLYDLHGNVWEWCEDAWHDRYTGAPRDGSPWLAGGDPGLRVLRGGAWDYDAAACRSANRYRGDPSMRRANGGLRLVWAEESGAPASGSPREPSRSGKRRGGRAPR